MLDFHEELLDQLGHIKNKRSRLRLDLIVNQIFNPVYQYILTEIINIFLYKYKLDLS